MDALAASKLIDYKRRHMLHICKVCRNSRVLLSNIMLPFYISIRHRICSNICHLSFFRAEMLRYPRSCLFILHIVEYSNVIINLCIDMKGV